MTVTNLLPLDRAALETWFEGLGERPFRARQVLKWIHQHGVTDFAQMTDLSRDLRERLAERATVQAPPIGTEQHALDQTRKWLLELGDGQRIESVFIPEPDRGTLCVSSQVGCALDCRFCSTAQQGFSRDLTTDEIIGQLWQAERRLGAGRVTNVVLMGMGEPLLNLDALAPALRLMLDDLAYGLSRRRVTVSTAGVVPMIERLREVAPVSLAVSLHAPDDDLRSELVPLNRKYPIADLLAACRRYVADEARARVTFEYVMIEGVNDSLAQARALGALLRDVPAKVNLIPFNPFPGTGYRRSPQSTIDAFRDVLVARGLTCVTRRPRGEDIDAACGQLVGRVNDRGRRAQRALVS